MTHNSLLINKISIMVKENSELIVATKDFTSFPIVAIGLFKPKDLYLLAGMYLSSHYQRNSDILHTDIAISQLSSLTGVASWYISEGFYPRLKRSGFISYKCVQEQPNVRRNHFYLPLPKQNFRFIRKELFYDRTLSPEEKGVMIGLYCLCLNNTFRYDLSDQRVWEALGISKNTFKKYRNALIDKNVLWSSYDAPMALTNAEHLSAKVLMYPHLGHKTWLDLVEEFNPTVDEINHYLLMIEDVA